MFDVSIIIVNWNTRDMLADCLNSIALTTGKLRVETIIVDNNSTDGSQAMVQERFPEARLIQNHQNAGFAKANNQALASMQGRCALLLNSDTLATPGSIQALIALADSQPRAGLIGAQLVNPDGTFQASHTPFPNLWQEFFILTGLGRLLRGRWYPSRGPEESKGPQKVDYVEGACMLVRREAFQQVGGLDEGYFMYAEEVDWCYAMKQAGWQVWYHPASRIVHFGGGSSKNRRPQREADLYRSRVRFFRKHHGNAAASALKVLIYGLTAMKIVMHRFLRLVSGNRRGRPVVGIGDLMASLREV